MGWGGGVLFKPFTSHNLIVKMTIYMHTSNKFIQMTKTLWVILATIASQAKAFIDAIYIT